MTRLTLRLKHNDRHLFSDADPFKKMSRKTKRSLKKLQEYQMNPAILVRLRRKFPFDQMSNHEINVCISEFKKFMAILAIGRTEKKKVAMTSEIVDQVWHEFLLFTKDYIAFSFAVRGDYIHHSPNTGDDNFGPDAARYFYETYAKYFGNLHPVWKLKIRESKVRYDPKTNTYCSSVSSNPVDKSPIANYALIKNGYQAQPIIFFGNSSDGGNSIYSDGQDSNSVDNAGVYGDNGASNLVDSSNPSSFTRYEITNKDMSSLTSCGSAFDSGCGGSCGADSDGGGDGGDGCSGCGGCGGCG